MDLFDQCAAVEALWRSGASTSTLVAFCESGGRLPEALSRPRDGPGAPPEPRGVRRRTTDRPSPARSIPSSASPSYASGGGDSESRLRVREHNALSRATRAGQRQAQRARQEENARSAPIQRATALFTPSALQSVNPRRQRIHADATRSFGGGLAAATLSTYEAPVADFRAYVLQEMAADANAAGRPLPGNIGDAGIARAATAADGDIALAWLAELAKRRIARDAGHAHGYVAGWASAVNTWLHTHGAPRVFLYPAGRRIKAHLLANHSTAPRKAAGLDRATVQRLLDHARAQDPQQGVADYAVALAAALGYNHVRRAAGIAWATWEGTVWCTLPGRSSLSVVYTIRKNEQSGTGMSIPVTDNGPRGLYAFARECLSLWHQITVPDGEESWSPAPREDGRPRYILPSLGQGQPPCVDFAKRARNVSGYRLHQRRLLVRLGFTPTEAGAIGLQSWRSGGNTGLVRAGYTASERLTHGAWASLEAEAGYNRESAYEVGWRARIRGFGH